MWVWTTHFPRKKLRLFLAAVILLFIALFFLLHMAASHTSSAAEAPTLTSNADRVAYLAGYGWEVSPEPLETLQLIFPEVLPDSYIEYNKLQKTQGFDLTSCCGKQVQRYTYQVLNAPQHPTGVQINLYICENQPVAGDVIVTRENGFQSGLAFPQAKEKETGP